VARRSERVLEKFEEGIPAISDILAKIMIGPPLGGLGTYSIAGLTATTDISKPPFTDLLKLYQAARNSFLGGAAGDVEQKFDALRGRIANLTDDELKSLGLDKGFRDEIVGKLDSAIADLGNAIKKIGTGPPPMRQMGQVPAGGGAIDTGLTFKLDIAGAVAPGTIDVFMADNVVALFRPAPGYRFAGEIFDLLESDDLDLTGARITVALTFGPGLLLGDPIDLNLPVCLARLANGNTDLLGCSSDPSVFELTGSYDPDSKSSGALQLGEFALVQRVPEPGSLLLLVAGLVALARLAPGLRQSIRIMPYS
jgi:PEP-CTERM motif-containing protein